MFDTYCVVDTETSGLDFENDKVVELAAVWEKDGELITKSSLVNPEGKHIPPEASALHHLTDDMVKDAPLLEYVIDQFDLPNGYIIAHNAPFDRNFLPMLAYRPWIDTLKISKHLYPDAPNFKNMTLKYFLNLEPKVPDNLAPHRALYDVLVTHELIKHILKTHTLQELAIMQNKPVLLRTVQFGKYRGQLWKDIDKSYLQWYLRTDDQDPDVKYTCQHYLSQ